MQRPRDPESQALGTSAGQTTVPVCSYKPALGAGTLRKHKSVGPSKRSLGHTLRSPVAPQSWHPEAQLDLVMFRYFIIIILPEITVGDLSVIS